MSGYTQVRESKTRTRIADNAADLSAQLDMIAARDVVSKAARSYLLEQHTPPGPDATRLEQVLAGLYALALSGGRNAVAAAGLLFDRACGKPPMAGLDRKMTNQVQVVVGQLAGLDQPRPSASLAPARLDAGLDGGNGASAGMATPEDIPGVNEPRRGVAQDTVEVLNFGTPAED